MPPTVYAPSSTLLNLGHVELEEALYAIEPFEGELVPCIELDTRLTVDALGAAFLEKL